MQAFLAAMIAVAFSAGGVGGIVWIGDRDGDISWYPRFSDTVAIRLLAIAAAVAGLAFVAWVFTSMT